MGKFNTVLLDFDGTVMNTNEVIFKSWQYTYKVLQNRDVTLEEIVSMFGEPLEYTVKKQFPEVPPEEAIRVYTSYHQDNFGEMISVFPGVREMLQGLKDRNIKVGLVTSRRHHTTMEGLTYYGIDQFFDAIVTGSDITKHKPDPEPVNLALQKLNSRPEEALMVGDTMFDILCGRNAGVCSVLVGWSLALKDKGFCDFDSCGGPHYILRKPDSIFDIL